MPIKPRDWIIDTVCLFVMMTSSILQDKDTRELHKVVGDNRVRQLQQIKATRQICDIWPESQRKDLLS